MVTIQAAQNQKETNTGGLKKLLNLQIGAKVMLTVHSDMQDRLINGQTGNISYTGFAQGSVQEVYVKFSDKQVGLKGMISSYLGRQNSCVIIEKCEAEIPIRNRSVSPFIKCTQFC